MTEPDERRFRFSLGELRALAAEWVARRGAGTTNQRVLNAYLTELERIAVAKAKQRHHDDGAA